MSFERLEMMAKAHHNTNRYKGFRLHMSRALSARMMQRYKPDIGTQEIIKLRDTVFGKPLLHELMGIPIINDVGITDECQWILVDPTGDEVERGEVEPESSFQWSYGPTTWDAEPGKKWHTDCGGEVMSFDGVHCCHKCGDYDGREAEEANADAAQGTLQGADGSRTE